MLITIKNWLNFTNALLKGVCRFTQLIIVGDVFNKCTHWSCRAMQDHWHVSENKANARICYWKCCNILLLSFFIWTDGIFIQWEDKKKGEECAAAPPFLSLELLGMRIPVCFQVYLFLEGQAQMNCYFWHVTEPAPSFAFHGKCGLWKWIWTLLLYLEK